MEVFDVRLSADGRTVTSLKLTAENKQVVEVWDSGKGTTCRVCLAADEHVTAFLQARLIDKNCLFACIKTIGGRHQLRAFEIGPNGEACDFWLQVDLTNEQDLLASSLYMGSDALYVSLQDHKLYKLEVLTALQANDFDSLDVSDHALEEYLPFGLAASARGVEVFHVCELENNSDEWRQSGQPPDLLAVVYHDGSIGIYDRATADLLKTVKNLPEPYSRLERELLEAAVLGDQLVLLANVRSALFRGPVLFYLDQTLEFQVRAQINLPTQASPIICASFSD